MRRKRVLSIRRRGYPFTANQVELIARNLSATMLGGKSNPDFML